MGPSNSLIYDGRLYDAQSFQKAAYRALNALTVDLKLDNGKFVCAISPNIGVDERQYLLAIQEFKKDVLDYQLRFKLKSETEQVRNLILGIAFSNTGLTGE
jgi:His-Xaa-Ser system protein HxsD